MNFSECLTVKLSHDLAGGIGALSSTVDLMNLDPSFVNEAPQMLKQNTDMLMARLKYYRALFGSETKSIYSGLVLDYLKTLGPKISFSGEINTRLELSLVACGLQFVMAGGDILYSNNTLIASSNNLILKENMIEILSNKRQLSSEVETLEAEWLMHQLNQENLTLKLIHEDNKIKLEIV